MTYLDGPVEDLAVGICSEVMEFALLFKKMSADYISVVGEDSGLVTRAW